MTDLRMHMKTIFAKPGFGGVIGVTGVTSLESLKFANYPVTSGPTAEGITEKPQSFQQNYPNYPGYPSETSRRPGQEGINDSCEAPAPSGMAAVPSGRSCADGVTRSEKTATRDAGYDLVAPPQWFERVASQADEEPDFRAPCLARRGRTEERAGVLLHFCAECGAWGAYGYGVSLRANRHGRWYCSEHRPGGR